MRRDGLGCDDAGIATLRRGLLIFGVSLAGCQGLPAPGATAPIAAGLDGAVARSAAEAAAQAGVPRDLIVAIAQIEGGLLLPRLRIVRADDHVPVAGLLELRHGAFDSLARGATLLSVDPIALQADTDLGTIAGARVLAELGRGARADDLAAWAPAVEELCGLAGALDRQGYRAEVYALLRAGGDLKARGGEIVHLPAHPELPIALTDGIRREQGNPDFPGAIWFDTPMNNKWTAGRPDGNGSVDSIVIHDTEGGWNASVATLQNDGGKSVHYIVDADGARVGQFIPETDTAWHAGNWCWNKHSVGIEHVGVASDPAGYSDGLYAKSVKLVESIRTRWKVPLDRAHLVGHYQIPNGTNVPECSPACAEPLDACEKSANYGGASNHRDPGEYWQWCQYMQRLGGTCPCADAWPLWNCTTDKTEAVRCKNGKVEIVPCAPCESKPNGQDDVCHAAPALDASVARDSALAPDSASASDDAGPAVVDAAAGEIGTGDGAAPGAEIRGGCHCAVAPGRRGAGLGGLGWAVIALALCRRRR